MGENKKLHFCFFCVKMLTNVSACVCFDKIGDIPEITCIRVQMRIALCAQS